MVPEVVHLGEAMTETERALRVARRLTNLPADSPVARRAALTQALAEALDAAGVQKAKLPDIEVVRVGADPLGRGNPTVFYRDYNTNAGRDVLYLWVEHWKATYPGVRLPDAG